MAIDFRAWGGSDPGSPLEQFAVVGMGKVPFRVLLTLTAKPDQHGDGCFLKGNGFSLRVTWPDRIPGLKTWAGQQSLPVIIRNRVEALKHMPEGMDPLQYQADCGGASGFDPRTTESLDLGFSPNALGMTVLWKPALELWAVIGLEFVNILLLADGRFGWLSRGEGDERGNPAWMVFRVGDRGKYGGRWDAAQVMHQWELEV